MSNFPGSIDDDSTIPSVYDNITEIGSTAINALKEAVIAIEEEIGFTASGSLSSLSDRLDVSLNPDGTINPSSLTGLGLVTLPIDDTQVATNAAILESKLLLDHSTQDLYNMIISLGIDSNTALGWINLNSAKISSHIAGTSYNHYTDQILVSSSTSNYLDNKFESARDNTNLYTLLSDINTDFVNHQRADGYGPDGLDVTTLNGLVYPDNFAHHAAGLYIDTTRFISIPKTTNDLQLLAEFIDTSSLLLFGSRVQNLYSNGISRAAISSTFTNDGYGQILIEEVTATTFLRTNGTSTNPVDDIANGDDIIELIPTGTIVTSNLFDAQFSLVKAGDIITVNYGSIETKFIIKEKKYIQSGGTKKFIVRIAGKNLAYTTTATVVISKPQYHTNKQHVLALAQAHNEFSEKPSLISINPRSPSVLGIGFNPNLIDSTHYNLYLKVYPNGNPADGEISIPAIDITGNQGATPGKYTLKSLIESANDAFRISSKNIRFAAFEYNGEFGIAMTDPYLGSSFSIVSAVVDASGQFDQSSTQSSYPNNIIDVFEYTDPLAQVQQPKDALGFGIFAANVASPPYSSSYSTAEQAVPTKVFLPLTKNNYYVNGAEKDNFGLEVDQLIDDNGDGYWIGTVTSKNTFPGPFGRVETTYQVDLDLRSSKLEIGKTLVVQPLVDGYTIDSGRFIIENVSCVVCSPSSAYTEITVYDAVHAQNTSPQTTLDVGSQVRLYFSDDSIGFNIENANDDLTAASFKRYFEIYIDSNGKTFSHERARFTINGSNLVVNNETLYASSNLSNFNIIEVSKKLRGYQFGKISKIAFNILSFNETTGMYSGYLCRYDGVVTKQGPLTTGYVGEVTRFFDESQIDYIDLQLNVDHSLSTFTNNILDIQLYSSLELDQEVFLLGSCTLNQSTNRFENLADKREFGNVSENELTKSALDFVSAGERYLHTNGVVQGFDLDGYAPNPANNQIYLNGGIAVVNGKFVLMNADTIEIPILKELYLSTNYNILWALCINDKNEYVTYPILDVSSTGNVVVSRRFTAIDPATGSSYKIEALNINTLLNRKDLLLLYTVSSSISGSSAPFTVVLTPKDARKFSYSSDGLVLKYTSDKEFGNFRSVKSLFTWMNLSKSYHSKASIKGADETFDDGSVFTLTSTSLIEIDGENDATLTFTNNSKFSINNVVLKNMTINFESSVPNLFFINNCQLINCTINGLYDSLSSSGYFIFLSGSKLIDCTIELTYDGTTYLNDKVISLQSNCIIENLDGTLNCTASIDATPNFITSSGSNNKINNSTFSGDFRKAIELTNCSNVEVVGNTIATSFSGANDSTYNSNYLCNYRSGGVVGLSCTSQIKNIKIEKNTFNCNNVTDRLSFIGVLLSNNGSSINSLSISENQFYSTGFTNIDMNAAIHVVGYTSTTNTTGIYNYLINSKINNNYANSHQNIIFAPAIHSDDKIYLNLVPISVEINGNICGSIGYFASVGVKESNAVSEPLAFTANNSSEFDLDISRNNCKYIRTSDGYGRTFVVGADDGTNRTSLVNPSTKIEKNNASFIHVYSVSTLSTKIISNNNLPAYDNSYAMFTPFVNSTFTSTLNNLTAYSIAVNSLAVPGLFGEGNVTISNNNIFRSGWVNSLGTPVSYSPSGYIRSDARANIESNTCYSADGSTLDLVTVGANLCRITNNIISRSASISSYIKYNNFLTGDAGSSTTGIVTNNSFDNSTIDGTVDNLLKANFPENWIVNQNINQVEYANFSLNTEKVEYNSASTIKNISNDSTVTLVPLQTNQLDIESLITVLSTADTNEKWYSKQWNLNNHLPTNVKIIGCKMNIRKETGTLNLLSLFSINCTKLSTTFSNQELNINVSSVAIPTILTDDPYIGTTLTDSVLGAEYNGAVLGASITIEIDSSDLTSNNFVINNGTPIILAVRLNYQVSSGTLNMLISPILLKYKW